MATKRTFANMLKETRLKMKKRRKEMRTAKERQRAQAGSRKYS